MGDSVSKDWGSVDGMGNWGMDGMGNNWGSMDGVSNNWGGMGNNWGSMGNWGSSVCWGSLVGDISDITIIVIGMILDVLDSAVGKVDGVFTIDNTGSVIVLSLLESSTRVVISNSVGVGVWGNLSKVISNISGLHWGMVSWGWGMVSWSSMDSMSNNWGSMDSVVNWGMDSVSNNWGSMDSMVNWGMDSMVNWGMDSMDSMGDNSISTVKSVGSISNNSSMGSESLALCCASVFSLVWFANRLMADLAVSISVNWSVSSVVDWSNGTRDWSWEDWGMDSGVVSVVHQTKVGSGGGQDTQTQESLHVYLLVLRR